MVNLLIWVSDWSMDIFSMHVSWETNKNDTCFAMHALEHAYCPPKLLSRVDKVGRDICCAPNFRLPTLFKVVVVGWMV